MKPGLAVLLLTLTPQATSALELDLPVNARETASVNTAPDTYVAPVGVYKNNALPGLTIEGEVRRSAFRIPTSGLTPLQVLEPLRGQLIAAGYQILLDCSASECGGFDFRFSTETLPAPGMAVNLRNFHFLTAQQGPEGAPDSLVTLLASASPAVAHLQIIRAGNLGNTPDQFTRQGGTLQASRPVARPAEETPDPSGDIAIDLVQYGHATLGDLDFGSGDVGSVAQPSDSLQALGTFLNQNENVRIALVGHTDNTGALDVNTAISLKRATAVRERLIADFGISPDRIEQHGVGFLAPIASNATEEGREANRRVEAVILSE